MLLPKLTLLRGPAILSWLTSLKSLTQSNLYMMYSGSPMHRAVYFKLSYQHYFALHRFWLLIGEDKMAAPRLVAQYRELLSQQQKYLGLYTARLPAATNQLN